MKKLISMVVIMLVTSISLTAKTNQPTGIKQDTISVTQDTVTSDLLASSKSVQASEIDTINAAGNLLSEVNESLVPIVGIVFVFGMPVLIILTVLVFRHKKQKAQYELVAKALEAGKDIPEGLFGNKNEEVKNTFTKGIINTCTGIGVAILLWGLVEFKFASIGLLISCIGIGQIIIYCKLHTSQKDRKNTDIEQQGSKSNEK